MAIGGADIADVQDRQRLTQPSNIKVECCRLHSQACHALAVRYGVTTAVTQYGTLLGKFLITFDLMAVIKCSLSKRFCSF